MHLGELSQRRFKGGRAIFVVELIRVPWNTCKSSIPTTVREMTCQQVIFNRCASD